MNTTGVSIWSAPYRLSDMKIVDPNSVGLSHLFKDNLAPPEPDNEVISDNHPSRIYATITKGGETIATLYLSGLIMTPNSTALPDNLCSSGHGIALAENRIKQIVSTYGGEVRYASTSNNINSSNQSRFLFDIQMLNQGHR
jgi:hypothetical protein